MPGITVNDVNAVINLLSQNSNKFIALSGPQTKDSSSLPTSAEILAVSDEVQKMDLKPYEEKAVQSSLLTEINEVFTGFCTTFSVVFCSRKYELSAAVIAMSDMNFMRFLLCIGCVSFGMG